LLLPLLTDPLLLLSLLLLLPLLLLTDPIAVHVAQYQLPLPRNDNSHTPYPFIHTPYHSCCFVVAARTHIEYLT
jgi:hypothetical protein